MEVLDLTGLLLQGWEADTKAPTTESRMDTTWAVLPCITLTGCHPTMDNLVCRPTRTIPSLPTKANLATAIASPSLTAPKVVLARSAPSTVSTRVDPIITTTMTPIPSDEPTALPALALQLQLATTPAPRLGERMT